jgi:hypothetical protein
MRPNTLIIRGSYLTKQVVEDCKAKMELGSVGTFSPGLTENNIKNVMINSKAYTKAPKCYYY